MRIPALGVDISTSIERRFPIECELILNNLIIVKCGDQTMTIYDQTTYDIKGPPLPS